MMSFLVAIILVTTTSFSRGLGRNVRKSSLPSASRWFFCLDRGWERNHSQFSSRKLTSPRPWCCIVGLARFETRAHNESGSICFDHLSVGRMAAPLPSRSLSVAETLAEVKGLASRLIQPEVPYCKVIISPRAWLGDAFFVDESALEPSVRRYLLWRHSSSSTPRFSPPQHYSDVLEAKHDVERTYFTFAADPA